MKRPAFQFYPADWRKDPALSACSLAARGLWIELMCIAHESETYGILTVNGRPMSSAQLARMVGETPRLIERLLAELEEAGVFSRNEEGAIFSRRMVKDEAIRNVRAEAGKKGGNPHLVGSKVGDLVKQTGKQSPTPSSSSSSSEENPLSPAHDDRHDIPGLSGYHPADWQPDQTLLDGYLAKAGIPMPSPEDLANALTRFNLNFTGKPLTTGETYSRLVRWLSEDYRRGNQTQTRPGAAAGQPAARKLTPVERAQAAQRQYLIDNGLDPDAQR